MFREVFLGLHPHVMADDVAAHFAGALRKAAVNAAPAHAAGEWVGAKSAEMQELWNEAKALGIHAPWIGTTGGQELKLGEARAISIDELTTAHESWFPRFMNN